MAAQAPAAPGLPAEPSTPVTRPRRVVVGRRLAITALVAGSVLGAASSIVSRRYLDPEGTPAERFAIDEHRLALRLALAAGVVGIPLVVLTPRRWPTSSARGSRGWPPPAPASRSSARSVPRHPLARRVRVCRRRRGPRPGRRRQRPHHDREQPARWVPASLALFPVLDVALNGRTGGIDPHPLWVAGCLDLAAVVARSTDDAWENG